MTSTDTNDEWTLSRDLTAHEVQRHIIRLNKIQNTQIKQAIYKGFLKAKIKGRIIEVHIDKYGRLYGGTALFEGLDKRKKIIVAIHGKDDLFEFTFTEEIIPLR